MILEEKILKLKNVFGLVFGLTLLIYIIMLVLPNNTYAATRTEDLTDLTKYPELYTAVQEMKTAHPNWTFTLLYTGLDWNNEANNGLCTDVIPKIREGRIKIDKTIKEYDGSKSPYSLGQLKSVDNFFLEILDDWREFGVCYPELVPHATFWIT